MKPEERKDTTNEKLAQEIDKMMKAGNKPIYNPLGIETEALIQML